MARHKNTVWNLGETVTSLEEASVGLLMDIRDELQTANRELSRINGLLNCTNFLRIPQTLRTISRNTTKRRKPKTIPKP